MGRIVHCPGNICPGDICPDREYLSCYWPNFDQTLGALIFLDQNFLWIKIWFDHFCFGPKYFLDWRQNVLVQTLFGPKLFRTPNYFGTKFFWPEFFIPNFFGHKTFWANVINNLYRKVIFAQLYCKALQYIFTVKAWLNGPFYSVSKCISRTGIGQTKTCPPFNSFGIVYTKNGGGALITKMVLGGQVLDPMQKKFVRFCGWNFP